MYSGPFGPAVTVTTSERFARCTIVGRPSTLAGIGCTRAGSSGSLRAPARWLALLGGVPLFFYLLQWYVAHGLSVLAEAVAGQDVAWHFMTPPERFHNIPPDAGFPLPVVYLLWITALAILYPLSRWYRAIRASRGGLFRYL